MARLVSDKDISPTLHAAREWMNRCLVADGSLLTSAALWTRERISECRNAFVEHPDAGKDDFMTKLKNQMAEASPDAQKLMAEMLWALLLFPSNTKPSTKRQHIREIWSLSGADYPSDNPMLTEEVIKGIGSGGPGFNNHRWRELAFLITLAGDLKSRQHEDRRNILTDYEAFLKWMPKVPQEGHRQFSHMLRYFAFPDLVERMSSNRDRRTILEAYGVAPEKETRRWSDRQLDEALLKLRRRLEGEKPGTVVDFYEPAYRSVWARTGDGHGGTSVDEAKEIVDEEPGEIPVEYGTNLILYGPPGTGKTHWLRQKISEYTDLPSKVDQETWLQEIVAGYGWRAVIASALNDLRRPSRVPEIRNHRYVVAKAKQRGRTPISVQPTIWGYLQEHTPEDVVSVKVAVRRPPYIFSKRESGEWELAVDWKELDDESRELTEALRAGPQGAREPIRRYRMVTFHPSFSYEDFIRGIRPIATAEDGTTQFRVVDGVFKQLCDEARSSPSKRYACFIDEINRANIAKVFGELISLIERDKRTVFDSNGRLVRGMLVQLPGAEESDAAEAPFGVPANLDIYGTMNTADRSIALLDVALRRRFEFREMEPDYELLEEPVGAVELDELLRRINERLEYLLDRDHRIGHAYLMGVQSLPELRQRFRLQIIPLLQEYFFDDLSRVAMVLATTGSPFIARIRRVFGDLFPGNVSESVPVERAGYVTTAETTWSEDSFRGIYLASMPADTASESL